VDGYVVEALPEAKKAHRGEVGGPRTGRRLMLLIEKRRLDGDRRLSPQARPAEYLLLPHSVAGCEDRRECVSCASS